MKTRQTKIIEAIADCDRYIELEGKRSADIQKLLEWYVAHRAKLQAMLGEGGKMPIVNTKYGFSVTDQRGRVLRSFAVLEVANGFDLVVTRKTSRHSLRASSTEAGAREWLEHYRHSETVADHLRAVKNK